MKSVKLVTEYAVKASNVTLNIKTGSGQLGVHYAKIGAKQVYKGDDSNGISIGKGTGLKGKKIRIVTVVSALNKASKKTSVTYTLKGGVKSKKWTVNEDIDSDRAVLYVAEISFI